MKNKKLIVLSVVLVIATTFVHAQEKFSVLITGNYDDFPNPSQWNGDEYWNDTFLMWELLQTKGYSNEKIIVLYSDGIDFSVSHPNIVDRYKPEIGITITDGPATIAEISDVFDDLATIINEDDFLFVWTFIHGIVNTCPPYGGYFTMPDGIMTDDYFAEKINQINCNKRVFWMQGDRSFIMVDELQNNSTVFHSSSNGDISFPADDIPVTENETYLINNQEIPYHHGEFDFHMYSSTIGNDPDGNYFYGLTPFSDADVHVDGYISIYEARLWEFNNESVLETPWYSDLGSIGGRTSLEWPTLISGSINFDPTYRGLIGIASHESQNTEIGNGHFLTLIGNSDVYFSNDNLDFQVNSNSDFVLNGNVTFSNYSNSINDRIVVHNGGTVTFKNGSYVNIFNDGCILVESGGSLIIEDNVTIGGNFNDEVIVVAAGGTLEIEGDATVTGINDIQIIINGFLDIGNNVTLQNLGMVCNAFYDPVELNYVQMVNVDFKNYREDLEINDCNFSNYSGLYSYTGNIDFIGSEITNSWIHFEDQSQDNHTVNVWGNNFLCQPGITMAGIDVWNYDNFFIFNNQINGFYNGMQINNSGYSQTGYQWIFQNTIYNCTSSGIIIYNSKAKIEANTIQNGRFGVKIFDRSVVDLVGNLNNPSNGQIIMDCKDYEVYASKNSFPVKFWHNLIIDEFNTVPLVYYNAVYNESQKSNQKDVRENYWGINFNPTQDLYPTSYFYYIPIWNPGDSGSDTDEQELMFNEALSDFEQNNFSSAYEKFIQTINNYPISKFTEASMKELFAIEKFTENNYLNLKEFYSNNDTIISDSNLMEVADFLTNKCDIELENWPTAIAWFEDVVENPESMEDSIFAIIDMGYTYWLMENSGLKSTYTGKMGHYKFSSREEFEANRDFLLSLLPGDQLSETLKQSISTLKSGELLQNVPNPFNGTTQIWLKLAEESSVTVTVYDYTGKEVSIINPGLLETGNHSVEFNSANLSSGIYFYSLEVNGIKTDTKKMTIIK